MTAYNIAWPTTTNVASAIGTLTMPAWITAADLLTSTVTEFERATGYQPFLAEGTDSDIRFSNYVASGDEISFITGYTSITGLYVDATEDDNGTELIEGTDWIQNPQSGTPIEGVTLFSKRRFSPYSIRVVGKRGFGAIIPPDAWDAVLWKAALPAFEAAAKAAGGTVEKVKQGPVEITFAGGATMSEATGGRFGSPGEIEALWKFVIQKYQRVSL